MGAIVIRTRYDEGTESAEVATSAASRTKSRRTAEESRTTKCHSMLNFVSNTNSFMQTFLHRLLRPDKGSPTRIFNLSRNLPIFDCCSFLFHLIQLDSMYHFQLQKGPGGSMNQVVGLPNNSYKPITNTAWVRARLCKLQERVHSTRSYK